MMVLVRCPKCKHDQKYHTQSTSLLNKRKQCVYCGRSFKVFDTLVKRVA